ncbi:hypothetical protein [Natronococcus amylolyticus]|uniref:hypothetical protein n=1 Tax=Natronococcus amylolyticus TaxID=44470 RepID=UPI001360B390|nr:hypothetical protein [Natronococcus amylolyticus]
MLAELDPIERNRYLFVAQAQGKDFWIERLNETCPTEQQGETLAFGYLSLHFAFEAVYDLHTTVLQFHLLERQIWAPIFEESDNLPSAEDREQASDRADDIRAQYTTLYIAYHGNRRFAEDWLGIEFETWLATHKHGSMVIDLAEDTLDDPTQQQLAEEWALEKPEPFTDEPIDDPLGVLVDRCYESRIAEFEYLSGRSYSG